MRTSANIDNASRAKVIGSSSDSNFFENIGINAILNAPSAKNLLNKLGKENATTNASAIGEAPKMPAIKISRQKPKRRDIKVQKPTVKNPRIIFMIVPLKRLQRWHL